MLDDTLVLDTWSSGSGAPSPVLPLLALARPELDADRRTALPGDVANRSLLATMAALGEPVLDTMVACPRCDEPNEIVLPIEVLTAGDDGPPVTVAGLPADLVRADVDDASTEAPTSGVDGASTGAPVHEVAVGGRSVRYRVPSVGDLEAARSCADPDAAERLLIDRALGGEVDRETLAVLAAELDERHPLLAPRVEMCCVSCGVTFGAGIDVAELAWASVSNAATRLVDEVAHLARAYGWSEAEVLAVPRARRAVYRRLIDDGLL